MRQDGAVSWIGDAAAGCQTHELAQDGIGERQFNLGEEVERDLIQLLFRIQQQRADADDTIQRLIPASVDFRYVVRALLLLLRNMGSGLFSKDGYRVVCFGLNDCKRR